MVTNQSLIEVHDPLCMAILWYEWSIVWFSGHRKWFWSRLACVNQKWYVHGNDFGLILLILARSCKTWPRKIIKICLRAHEFWPFSLTDNSLYYWQQKIVLTSGLPRLMKNGISQFFRLDITNINTYSIFYQKLLITKACLYNFDPLKPLFYIVKLGFTGLYIIFLISAQKHRLWVLVRTASSRRF